MIMKKITLLMLCIMLFFTSSVQAGTIYLVDNTATGGPGGAGWRAASANEVNVHLSDLSMSFNAWYASITFATSSDQVWLLSDTYTLTGPVGVKTNGKIYGGFYGTETSISFGSSSSVRRLNTSPAGNWDLKYPSILDGNATYQGMSGGSSSAVVDGLTIQNCKYTGTSNGQAAGVTLNYSTTAIQNCIVTGCVNSGSGTYGATSAVSLTAATKMINSYVHDNTYSGSGSYGGGAVSVIASSSASGNYTTTQTDVISGCKITNNSNTTSNYGGGVFLYSAVADGLKSLGIKNSIISNNTCFGNGGGIYVYIGNFNNTANTTPVLISGCTFDSNTANSTGSYGGGAIYINNSTTTNTNNTFTLQNCTFTNNRAATTAPAATQGSAFYSNANITINNCVVAGNVGTNAFYLGNASGVSASVNNCTIANNVNLTSGAVQFLYSSAPATASTFTNTIIFNQTASPLNTSSGTKPTVTYCGFDNSVSLTSAPYNGTGNIKTIASSSFKDPTHGDWSLASGTGAINTGTTIAACSPDISGVTRPQGAAYDMGAYEYITKTVPTVTINTSTYGYNKTAVGPNSATNTGTSTNYIFTYTGTGSTTYGPSTLQPTNAGTYNVTASVVENVTYAFAYATASFTISPKALTIGAASIASKTYDGSATSGVVTAGSLSGFVSSETVTVSSAVGTYGDANVGTGKLATIVYTLSDGTNGGLAANYSLANGSGNGDITAISATLSGNLGTQALLAGTDVTVATNTELTVDNSVNVHSITVAPLGKLTINDTKSLTTGDLSLQSSASGSGTLVDVNSAGGLTVTGTANVQQWLTGKNGTSTRGLWYFSSPVSTATAAVFDVATGTNKMTRYDETIPGYVTQFIDNATALTPGVGYVAQIGGVDAAYTFSTSTGSNTAKLNSGAITIPVTRTGTTAGKRGFNLVGNPYPSFLDWKHASNTKTNLRSTIWYRTSIGTGSTMTFDTYDGTTGTNNNTKAAVNQYIPPMQAFWVKVNADGDIATLTFANAARLHDQNAGANNLRAPAQKTTEAQIVRLRVSNGTNSDETILVADANATDAFDTYDSEKMSNDNAAIPEIYTLVGSQELVINHLSDFALNKQVALGFRPGTTSTFSIVANEITNVDAQTKVILIDKLQNNAEFDLTSGTAYTFNATAAPTADRFVIAFRAPGVATNLSNENTVIMLVYKNANNQIIINRNSDEEGIITVCNAIGQKLVNKPTTGTTTVISNSFSTGVYFVTVSASGSKTTQKITIN